MTSTRSVVFVNPVRTAIGTFGGSIKEVAAPDLGAAAIKAAIGRAGLKPDDVDTVVMGNVIQAGLKMNPARQAAIQAGLPVTVPAMTVNRVCGSGAQAVVSAAQEILLGTMDVAVARSMYLAAKGRLSLIGMSITGRKRLWKHWLRSSPPFERMGRLPLATRLESIAVRRLWF